MHSLITVVYSASSTHLILTVWVSHRKTAPTCCHVFTMSDDYVSIPIVLHETFAGFNGSDLCSFPQDPQKILIESSAVTFTANI